jgi:hypothetical protein
MLKWLHENKCPWDAMTCAHAAACGNLEMLQWARGRGCPWDEETSEYAGVNEHLEVLKWAIENGCKWNKVNLLRTARREITSVEKCRVEFAKSENAVLHMSASIEGFRRLIEYVQSLDGEGR